MSVRKKMKIFWWFKGIERNQSVARNGLKSYFKNSPSRSTIHFSRISYTAWKCPDSGKYFPAFGLNTDRYVVSLRIQSECGKILTGKTPNKDTFHFPNDIRLMKFLRFHRNFETTLVKIIKRAQVEGVALIKI